MKIGLVDVDGHNYPNLALMRISTYHKSIGDQVEWWQGNLFYYDKVYMSKIFSDTYSKEKVSPYNCEELIKGGTGYAIKNINGREIYNKELDKELPLEIEHMFPDYSIYPQFDFCVSMTSRGCPRSCPFCHVSAKEGRCSHKVADVSDFWSGQKHIDVLDPNITACKEKRELFAQYKETNATITFNQGLDIRLINEYDIQDINAMRIKNLHFAWDDPKADLESKFRFFKDNFKRKTNIGMVYILTNFNSNMSENLYRVYKLRDMGFDPYIMVYDKPNAPKEIRQLQRWVNNKYVFNKCKTFEEYKG